MGPIAVQEVVRGLGKWSVTLRDLPRHLAEQIQPFGHIVIDSGRDNPAVAGDALLASARYVGVLMSTEQDGSMLDVSGPGMAFWLGSADKVGDVFETARVFTNDDFSTTIAGLLPSSGAVTAGAISNPTFGALFPGTDVYPGEDVYPADTPDGVAAAYTGRHQWQSPREAVDYVCDLFGCDWRVNGDGTLDAGSPETLFRATPTAAVVRRADGGDQNLRGLSGTAKLATDVEDFSTRVINLAEGNGKTVAVGTADIDPALNPYLDIHGNPVKLARVLSESNTSKTNADARAALALSAYTSPRDSLDLSTTAYDIRGDVEPGDSVWVYDVDTGLVDNDTTIQFRGERIHPVKLRVYSLTWAVVAGMGVYYRAADGTWLDLTDWVEWESRGSGQITVGGYDRSLTNQNREAPGARVVADSSVPGVPALVTPFASSVYQSTAGFSRAQITATWVQPANTDGTAIQDGDRYEVQFRTPAGSGEWSTAQAGFDTPSVTIRELLPATTYGIRVRAVDTAQPPNFGAWSAEQSTTTAGDTIPPATPAAPVVRGNPVAIQVEHTLGAASGGTYNLAPDLRVLEVHASESGAGFTPTAATKLGNLTATYSMLLAQVPAIGTFTVTSTAPLHVKVIAVDESGNASAPSAAATATATLISDIYVSNLSATKIAAGEFSAAYAVTGLMISGNPNGSRFESGTRGLLTGGRTYRPSNTLAVSLDASTGDLTAFQPNGTTRTFRVEASTGNVFLYKADGTTPAMQLTASTGVLELTGRVIAGTGIGVGRTIDINPALPSIDLYPDATTERIRKRAFVGTIPTGGVGAVYRRDRLNSAGQTDGPSLVEWVSGIWHVFRSTNDSVIGAYYKLQSNGVAIFGNDAASLQVGGSGDIGMYRTAGGVVQVQADGDVFIDCDDGRTITFGDGIGSGGAGFSFKVQGLGNATFRTFFDSQNNCIRFVDNASNQYVSDGAGGLKSFVIPHPADSDRWLVHVATESPEALVEYHGEAVLRGGTAVVDLPAYFEGLAADDGRRVHVTMLLPDEPLVELVESPLPPSDFPSAQRPPLVLPEHVQVRPAAASVPRNGRFRIACPAPDGTRVSWRVVAPRRNTRFEVEPHRSTVNVHGDGPYRYLTPKDQAA